MRALTLARPWPLWHLIVRCCLMRLLGLSLSGMAATLAVPPLNARVTDQTGTLDAAQVQALESQLAGIESSLGSQIVVLMIPSTQGEDIAAYAFRVADQWKVGRREVGDGLLLVVAKDDRTVRIEVARALEGAIPDLAAHQIIERVITPAFRTGDFAGGLSQGVEHLASRIRKEALPLPEATDTSSDGGDEGMSLQNLGLLLLVGATQFGGMLTRVMGRKLGALVTGLVAGAVGWWLSTSLLIAAGVALVAMVLAVLIGPMAASAGRRHGGWGGGGGGGWGGGGGGGFSSGGGGSFGGGGASGRW